MSALFKLPPVTRTFVKRGESLFSGRGKTKNNGQTLSQEVSLKEQAFDRCKQPARWSKCVLLRRRYDHRINVIELDKFVGTDCGRISANSRCCGFGSG